MEIFLARHLEVDVDARSYCIGQTDVFLSAKGKAGLGLFAKDLKTLRPQTLITSDLVRCKELADKVAEESDVFVKADPLWREVNFGEWENRTWDDLCHSDQNRVEHWMHNFVSAIPPGGESYMMLFQRVQAQLERLTERPEKRILIVTHAGVIRAAMSFVLGIPLDKSFSVEVNFGCVAGIRYDDGRWSLFSFRNREA